MDGAKIAYEVYRVVEGAETDGPLECIQVARQMTHSADTMARNFARNARGQGHSWLEIAYALGIDPSSTDPAAEAFEWVAPKPSMSFDTIRVVWTCASCDASVVDTGPYGGHPDDTERGHTAGCVRHQDEVEEYLRLAG